MIQMLFSNPLLIILLIMFFIVLVAVAFIILVLMGNLTAMKILAENGVAVFCRDIIKDYKLLTHVNKEGIGWLHIPDVCYTPIMKYSGGKYKENNFLQKPNMYGEIYVTEGESASMLKNIALESDNDISDLTIIRGSAKGSATDLRHANFSILRKCSGLLKEQKVIELCDKGRIRKFDIIAVLDMTLGEKHEFQYTSRDKFLNSLLDRAKIKTISEISNNNHVVLLQCKTEIDTLMIVLLERKEGC